ncbi:remodeling and spacing factor 1 [Pristimantis euphronides]
MENDSSCKADGDKPLKTSSEIKTQPPSDIEEEAAKEKDSFKENIKPVKTESKDDKAELKDLRESKGSSEKTPPPQDPDRAEVSVIVKRTEEHVEDTEKMKNDQQAKIPLKKRELKLTDDFDSTVKAPICKSRTPTKELLQKEEGKLEEDGTKTSDWKQLVNGEVNSDKVNKGKVKQMEDGSSAPRESVIECAKDENGIANEKRNSSVIKSLQELKDNGKAKIVDGLEKSVADLSNDRSTPPVQETTEADSSKSDGLKVNDDNKNKLDSKKEKPPQAKEKDSKKDASHSETIKETDIADEVPPAESKDGKGVEQTAEQSVSDEKVEVLEDDCSKESQSKGKDVKNKTTKTKLPVFKKSSTRNSAAKKEKPSKEPEEPSEEPEKSDALRTEPKSTEKAETDEKHLETVKQKKTFSLRSKRKPSAVKESEAKEVDDEEAAEEDEEKTSSSQKIS